MEIRPCWLPTHLHLFVKGLSISQFAPCCRPSWRRHLILFLIILVLAGSFFLSANQLIGQKRQSLEIRHAISNDVSRNKRNSFDKSYGTQSSILSWDYSDPILVDLPREVVKTTAESSSTANTNVEKDFSYGVMIDCGSSGSRVFVYYWPKHSGEPTELLKIQQLNFNGKPVVKKIIPGIATFMNKPFSVKSYLKPLLDYAAEHIPADKHKETPLYVLCTAGMRMLTKRLQASILDQVQHTIQTTSNFQFYSSHAEVISGMTEGLYFWMGLNYALGNLHQPSHSLNENLLSGSTTHTHNRHQTIGVIDMGGGSLQIAYEVDAEAKRKFPKQVMEINLGCVEHKSEHEYKVFVDTFLHKGGNAVRGNYERDLVLDFLALNNTSHLDTIKDPCLPLGFIQEVKHTLRESGDITLFLNGTGDFGSCREKILAYLDKSDCEKSSQTCILNGRSMPLVNHNRDKFFGSSEFFYCMEDVLRIGGAYDKYLYEAKAQEYCATPWNATWQKYNDGYFKYADAHRVKFQCFKSAWVSAVLHEGFNFPETYKQFTTVKYINGSEIQWTLGAILYKTRYLPLREIQLQSLQVKSEKSGSSLAFLFCPFTFITRYGSVLLILCIGIALLFIFISLIRFCLHMDQKKVASLRRVGSSVAYFVHEEV